jgi:N-6 DNA Methylase
MSSASLTQVLEATGYFPDGQAAPGLHLGEDAQSLRRGRDFSPDALWRSPSSLTVYFKFEELQPSDAQISKWRREIWNEGFAPLLWVISPERIDLYNGFGAPVQNSDARENLIRSFANVEASLNEADSLAGRLSIETGQFWQNITVIDRKTSVDHKLLYDLHCLERDLVQLNLERGAAQALIGRVIFTQYLIDREIVTPKLLKTICGNSLLPPILRDGGATGQLFEWLSRTFNGDMFPASTALSTPDSSFLNRVADFLEAVNPETRQTTFFPYRFDVIPVELISSIYEQFAHAQPAAADARSSEAEKNGVHYTRLSLVSLVLDEVMDGMNGTETVLDLTCGSGVFLVEALRRLVALRTGNDPPTRALIRAILYKQVYGVDISETAVRVAAFSLYLAALELDPDPQPPHSLKFQPLIGKTLVCGDAHSVELSAEGKSVFNVADGLKKFDLIIGNPPWSFKGRRGTEERRKIRIAGTPSQPRGEGLDFVLRAAEFSHEKTRFGVILSAIPFFSRSDTGMAAALHVMKLLSPVTIVNLSSLSSWLFATATMPAVILFARHRPQPVDQVTVVQIPWSASGARTQTFEVSPSDINRISLSALAERPLTLKAAAVGLRRDIALLDVVTSTLSTLGQQLGSFGTELHVGMIRGLPRNQTRDAKEMKGLPLLEVENFEPFHIPDELSTFTTPKAQWPRSRDIYREPILIVKETLSGGPRTVVAVAERDLVYTNAFFGASLPSTHRSTAHVLAAILSSSFASWFFVMSASEFGIWKRRVLRHDVALLPIPELRQGLKSDAGKLLLQMSKRLQKIGPTAEDFASLDQAVFDLYELDSADRVVVEDGLRRASWQWQAGRESSVGYADINSEMIRYSTAFMSVIHGWLSARKKRRIRAEILNFSKNDPLRVVRFVIENGSGRSSHKVVQPDGELRDVLDRIGKRLHVKIATALSGARELRIYGPDEVIIIKPAAARYWMGICGLEDADAVVAESFEGRTA